MLLGRLGLDVADLRDRLSRAESPVAPDVSALFDAARAWSLAVRHDPEFLTDALLLAVLRADPTFRQQAAALGVAPEELEGVLRGPADRTETHTSKDFATPSDSSTEFPAAQFALPNALAEVDAARVLDANFNRAREAA
ncbi:MAG: hypothetical protein ACKODX_12435, partial [Gemmata sp.]